MKKIIKWVVIGFFALVALGIIIDAMKSPEEKAADAAAAAKRDEAAAIEKREALKRELDALPNITAMQLERAYAENTVAADQAYKGKKFKVSGVVTNINTNIAGNPYLTLGGANQFMEPQFEFDKGQNEQLAKLKKGSRVSLVCTGRGDIAKTPMSDSCTIL